MPDAGARLVVATDAAQGLLEAINLRPNLILLDMNLPDMDGLGVLHALRNDPRSAHVPVIAVSADAWPEQVRAAREAGMEDYWTKPINLKRVHAELLRRFPALPLAASHPPA